MIDPSAAGRGLQVMEPLPPTEAEAADMLFSLPTHLLDDILTRLDLHDVVRTSVLSCAWRRRWESIHGLALSFPKGTPPLVIAGVLLRYTGPIISRFACYVANNDGVDDWVITLSRRSVQSISIDKVWRMPPVPLTLHSSIFFCDRLESLNLHHCIIPPIPRSGFAGFPVLQELYLSSVDFTDEGERGLQAIIWGSPILRVLEFNFVFLKVGCVIEAPNLQTLVLDDLHDDEGWRFGRLPRLQYAKIDVYVNRGHRLLEFFAGVSQVQKLILYSPVNLDKAKIDKIPFTFHNLKRLEIVIDYVYMEFIFLLFSLLKSSPNLVELKLEFRNTKLHISEEWTDDAQWTDAQWTDGMCSSLQVVQIESSCGWLPLSLLKLILSKASLLRILSMDVCPDSQDDPLNELLKCRRASAHAQVLFKEDLDSDDTDRELSE